MSRLSAGLGVAVADCGELLWVHETVAMAELPDDPAGVDDGDVGQGQRTPRPRT